eukprot:TRINITY_DN58684_c0_g1_i1.p1 TRINITY_DN58684_c0_g1~~TRINITY_DN58684_c0_g1_i1.p1  ORF type:complete len:248 (-),score=22.09 TRINITY_DN58684_c0_g1_i1:329-1072(-)
MDPCSVLADLLEFYEVRIRSWRRLEAVRIFLQLAAVFLVFSSVFSILFLPLAGLEAPWSLPLRIYRDTFGPFSALGNFELPLMNRTRYEQPDNMWSPVMFSPDSFLGDLQDKAYELWNWGLKSLRDGPMFVRFQVFVACCMIYGPPLFMAYQVPWQKIGTLVWQHPRSKNLAAWIVRQILTYTPERLLILEQLMYARRNGRCLSKSASEELEALEDPQGEELQEAMIIGSREGAVSRSAGHAAFMDS